MELSTTLTTFMLKIGPATQSVQLFGSWDNFNKPYPMERDSRRGGGYWRGCHTFENIISDSDCASRGRSRNGGLKMGGKYWYYYQLDSDIEYHDPLEPFTTSCPFLPGQPVNILDVPVELGPGQSRSRSGSESSIVFSRPKASSVSSDDAFMRPRAPPVPRLPRLSTSSSSLERNTKDRVSPHRGLSIRSAMSTTSSPLPSPSTAIGRFLPFVRKSSSEDQAAPPASPALSIRSAFSQFKAPHTAVPGSGTTQDVERDRCSLFSRDKHGNRDSTLEIGDPVLISRSDEGRHCIPISRPSSPTPTVASTPSTLSRSREGSPLRVRLARASCDALPLASNPVECENDCYRARAISNTQERGVDGPTSGRSHSRSREPSPLRNSVKCEEVQARQPVTIPDDIVEVEEDEDDFNFHTDALSIADEETGVQNQLSAPPSRRHDSKNLRSARSIDSQAEAAPELKIECQPSQPLPQIATNSAVSDDDVLGSRFSIASANTAALSPTSMYSLSPTSPPLSPMMTFTNASPNAYRLSAESSLPSVSDDSEAEPSGYGSCNGYAAAPRTSSYTPRDEENTDATLKDLAAKNKRHASFFGTSAFQGYVLPDEGRGSEPTITKTDGSSSLLQAGSRTTFGTPVDERILQAAWSDDSPSEPTAMESLLSELGYLGDMIVD
ncbi:MAG: hypothetical protein M1825_002443 [Sarcosagium campestre]|nr:MAG: hypothetical protein M1825_002443 [Sarcosagium campestre]